MDRQIIQTQLRNAGKGAKIGSSLGATLGSVIPGIGTAIGGAAGMVAGAGVGNLVGGIKNINHMINGDKTAYSPQLATFAKYGLEVEGGETSMRPNGSFASFKGAKHAQGGIPYKPFQKGEFIFSDTAGYNKGKLSMKGNKTFAELSKKYLGEDDQISMNSLEQLKRDNKSVLSSMKMKYGGDTKKYQFGGDIDLGALSQFYSGNQPLPFAKINPVNSSLNPINSLSPLTPKQNLTIPTTPANNVASNLAGIPSGPSASKPGIAESIADPNAALGLSTMAFKLPSVAYNIGKGLGKVEEEPLRLNAEGSNAISLMSKRKYDPTQVYNRIQQAATKQNTRVANQNISSFAKTASNQAVTNNSMGALADANLQGQQLNNQYRAQEASTRFQVGASNASERIRQNTVTSQNKAARNSFMQAGLNDVARAGDVYNNYKITTAQNKEMANVLSSMAKNFGISIEQLMKHLAKGGNTDNIITYKNGN